MNEAKTLKRKCLENADCTIARSLEVIGDWWSILILREAFLGYRRFGEFQSRLGMARNILSARLRKLVAHGILEQVPASDGSAYQEYALTEKARGLELVLMALQQWGNEYLLKPGEQKGSVVHGPSGQNLQPLELRKEDGETVCFSQLEFRKAGLDCASSKEKDSRS